MGMFDKFKGKQKEPKETNEIENRELKVNLADTAMGMLEQGVDYQELAGIQ